MKQCPCNDSYTPQQPAKSQELLTRPGHVKPCLRAHINPPRHAHELLPCTPCCPSRPKLAPSWVQLSEHNTIYPAQQRCNEAHGMYSVQLCFGTTTVGLAQACQTGACASAQHLCCADRTVQQPRSCLPRDTPTCVQVHANMLSHPLSNTRSPQQHTAPQHYHHTGGAAAESQLTTTCMGCLHNPLLQLLSCHAHNTQHKPTPCLCPLGTAITRP